MRSFISPQRYVQGIDSILKIGTFIENFGGRALFLIDGFLYDKLCLQLKENFKMTKIHYVFLKFSGEVTVDKIAELGKQVKNHDISVVVGIGGGKTIDTAKAIADKQNCFSIIVPTTASTDAPCSSLSIIHNEFTKTREVYRCRRNPDLVLVDSRIIKEAPIRFFIAGMGDGLATYPEARATKQAKGSNFIGEDYYSTNLALYISRACNEIILTQGAKALSGIQNGYDNEEVENVIEAIILLSGLGFENSGCAGAHSISKGISAVKECENLLHGEKVAFGTLCQLIAEEQIDEYNVLLDFYNEVGLPITLSDLGIKTNKQIKIEQIALESMTGGFWNNEPFTITLEGIMNYIKEADARGLEYKLIQIKE